MTQTIAERYALRTATAREFRESQHEYFMEGTREAMQRYMQARAMLTYLPNMEHAIRKDGRDA